MEIYNNASGEKLSKINFEKPTLLQFQDPISEDVCKILNLLLLKYSDTITLRIYNYSKDFKGISFLKYLSNLKNLRLNIVYLSNIEAINEDISLKYFAISDNKKHVDLRPLLTQKDLEILSFCENDEFVNSVSSFKILKELSLFDLSIRDFSFIKSNLLLESLTLYNVKINSTNHGSLPNGVKKIYLEKIFISDFSFLSLANNLREIYLKRLKINHGMNPIFENNKTTFLAIEDCDFIDYSWIINFKNVEQLYIMGIKNLKAEDFIFISKFEKIKLAYLIFKSSSETKKFNAIMDTFNINTDRKLI